MSEETFRYHVNDFLKAYYGPGWLEIRKYIDLEHEATADIHMGCFAYCDMNYPLWFIPTEYLSSEIREHLKKNYDASPYQPALEDYPLRGLANRLDEVNAHIKSGILYYAGEGGTESSVEIPNGTPVYGLEVGQRVVSNGVKTFNKYARFTANKLSFYDQNDNEVAYISDYKLYISSVEITGSFKQGGFVDKTLEDKSVVTKWIGGS
jgi:hypothetical protein